MFRFLIFLIGIAPVQIKISLKNELQLMIIFTLTNFLTLSTTAHIIYFINFPPKDFLIMEL